MKNKVKKQSENRTVNKIAKILKNRKKLYDSSQNKSSGKICSIS